MPRYSRILTVTQAASDTLLVSLATAKDELNITDNSLDTRLTRWIKDASAEITGYISRPLRLETVTETFRADSFRSEAPGEHYYPRDSFYGNATAIGPAVPGLAMRRYPITTVASIVEDGTTLNPTADYEVDGEFGIIYRLNGTSRVHWYGQVVQIGYAGGYPTADDVPGDIQAAALIMLKYRSGAQGRDPSVRALTMPGVIEKQWFAAAALVGSSSLPPEAEALIQSYRDVHA